MDNIVNVGKYIAEYLPELLIAVIAGLIIPGVLFVLKLPRKRNPIRMNKVVAGCLGDYVMIDGVRCMNDNVESQESCFRGCLLHGFFSNVSDSSIAIEKLNLVVDNIHARSYQRVDVIMHFFEDRLRLYIVNNGNVGVGDFRFSLAASWFDLDSKEYVLDEQDLRELLGNDFKPEYQIDFLEAGEILEFASFRPNMEVFTSNYLQSNWLIFHGIIAGVTEKHKDRYMGTLLIQDNKFAFSYCQGGGPDDTEKYALELHTKDQMPKVFGLPADFSVAAMSDKHIQVAVYPDETCMLQFHFEMKGNTIKHCIISEKEKVTVYVPMYETDSGFYHTLREWLMKNQFSHYRYNQDRLLQKDILPRKLITVS